MTTNRETTPPTPNAAQEERWRIMKEKRDQSDADIEHGFYYGTELAAQDDPAKGLEVVAHMRRWAFDKEPEFKVRDPNTNRMRLHRKFTLYATTVPKMLKDDVPLTDHATASRQIAELRSRVAELEGELEFAKQSVEQYGQWHVAAEAENKGLREDVEFLLARSRKAGSVSFGDKRRWTGMSSNAIVEVAYGGTQTALPCDSSDYMSCLLCVKRLPRHRRTPAVAEALKKAKAAFRSRYPRQALAAKEAGE